MQPPMKVYGGTDVNLHTSQSDFEVEVFFVASCSLCSRKPCYMTFWILNPFFLSRIEPHSSNSVLRKYVSNETTDRCKIF